jgi:hypothetical protein
MLTPALLRMNYTDWGTPQREANRSAQLVLGVNALVFSNLRSRTIRHIRARHRPGEVALVRPQPDFHPDTVRFLRVDNDGKPVWCEGVPRRARRLPGERLPAQ